MAVVTAGTTLGEQTAAAPAGVVGQFPNMQQQQQQQQQLQQPVDAAASGAVGRPPPAPAATSPATGTASTFEPAAAPLGSMADEEPTASSAAAEGALEAVLLSLNREAASSSLLNSLVMHMAALAAVFLMCDLAANFVALVLLPKMLSSLQLQLWCPAQPYTPYKIAGEVYEYL